MTKDEAERVLDSAQRLKIIPRRIHQIANGEYVVIVGSNTFHLWNADDIQTYLARRPDEGAMV